MTVVAERASPGTAGGAAAHVLRRRLPSWPLYALFMGFPLWWVLGIGSFAVVVFSVPMVLALVLRGNVRIPWSFLPWLVFLAVMLTSVIQIDTGLRVVGFAMRAANYLGATVVFVYLFNISTEQLPTRRVVRALVAFWGFVVFGGFLGLIVPEVSFTTPVARVLPASVLANEYVQELVLPSFAEIQEPFGADEPFIRPSAPFAYTNGWGCAYALLLPVVLLAIQQAGPGWRRVALVVALAASALPAFATLNRGMFLAVGIALGYVCLRLALRGDVRLLAAVLAVVVLGLGGAAAVGVQDRIAERTTVSGTNATRVALYAEAVERTSRSPVLGYGAPRPSEEQGVSVGTQGQVWNVMFSFGFLGLAAFLGWLWSTAWRTRDARGPERLWLHVVIVVASFSVVYYGYDGMQLSIVMVAAALLARPSAGAAAP